MAKLWVTISSLFMLAVLADTVGASRIDVPDEPLEAAFRHIAGQICQRLPCYLAVEGKPPSESLLKRLRDLPNTRPVAAGKGPHRPADDLALVINLRRLKFLPDGTARLDELTTVGDRALSSCTHSLSRDHDGWRVDRQKTMCDVI